MDKQRQDLTENVLEMQASLIDSVNRAGGVGSGWTAPEIINMTVSELMRTLAPNGIRFCVKGDNECYESRELIRVLESHNDDLKQERDSAYLNRDIAEDKTKELKAERDMLAYENKNLARFIKYNNSTLTDIDVGDIATSGFTGDIWDRFINESEGCNHLINNNIKLRRVLNKIENICKDEI